MTTKYGLRVAIDVILFCISCVCLIVVKHVSSPHMRGMFCDDQEIRLPYTEHETISDSVLMGCGILIPALTMLVVEYMQSRRGNIGKPLTMCGHTIHSWFWGVYSSVGMFLFGCACSQLATDIAKYSIGRLRPHFIEVCQPDWSKINCSASHYIDPIPCLAEDSHRLKEARLSFPSGHASFSAFTMVYLVIYLQVRLQVRAARLIKPCFQFVCLMLAFYTSLTRISDYKHHWSDVLSGVLLGTFVAVLVGYYAAELGGKSDYSSQNQKDEIIPLHISGQFINQANNTHRVHPNSEH